MSSRTSSKVKALASGLSSAAIGAGVTRLLFEVSALHLRSVCRIITAFRGLRCHPLTCMSLKVRLSVDSIPFALTIFQYFRQASVPFPCHSAQVPRSFRALPACPRSPHRRTCSLLCGCPHDA